jgi:hypothetical protein
MAQVPELKAGQMITLAYIIGIVIVIFIIYKVLQKVGLIKTSAEIDAAKAYTTSLSNLRTDTHFDPAFLTDNQNIAYKPIGDASQGYAEDIHDSIYGFLQIGTNAEKIFSTFSKCFNKFNISEIAGAYLKEYDRDMRSDLLNNLSDDHVTTLNDIIGKLPENT